MQGRSKNQADRLGVASARMLGNDIRSIISDDAPCVEDLSGAVLNAYVDLHRHEQVLTRHASGENLLAFIGSAHRGSIGHRPHSPARLNASSWLSPPGVQFTASPTTVQFGISSASPTPSDTGTSWTAHDRANVEIGKSWTALPRTIDIDADKLTRRRPLRAGLREIKVVIDEQRNGRHRCSRRPELDIARPLPRPRPGRFPGCIPRAAGPRPLLAHQAAYMLQHLATCLFLRRRAPTR